MELTLENGITASFPTVNVTETGVSLYGPSSDNQYMMKIELREALNKEHDLHGEATVMRRLNKLNCRTCPTLMLETEVLGSILEHHYTDKMSARLKYPIFPDQNHTVTVTEFFPKGSPIFTPDLLMAIVEQKKLGVWNGDITAADILYDPKTQCIKIVDYDQAILLDDKKMNMPNLEYFEWLDETISSRFSEFGLTHMYTGLGPTVSWEEHFLPFFKGNSVNLAATNLFASQETTMNTSKIYHSFANDDVYADGERTLDDRKAMLNNLKFKKKEKVLDVGCNVGLLCHYLQERNCDVWGIDIDPSVIEGAQILANIMGKPEINFECHDVDNGGPIGHFDTIFLFSVIHHTANIRKNAARIAKLCNRIVIECRLIEQGAKPVNGKWIQTTVWKHEDFDSLVAGLEVLFPGFKLSKTLGQGDRDRYMLEFKKK